MTMTNNEDPAAIENEIRRTQENMSSTIDKIGDQLTIKNVFNSLLDKADENNVDARMVLDGARRNPLALGLIAIGTIWLISENDAKLPKLPARSKFKSSSDRDSYTGYEDYGVSHSDYETHMSAIQRMDDEDDIAYQSRHDSARSSFFKVERNAGEDESSFRKRLDSLTEKLRTKRQEWARSGADMSAAAKDRARDLGASAKEKARMASDKTQDLYGENPLIGGLLAAAVGAVFGASVPVTRSERDKLGTISQKARATISEQTDKVASQARDKKDELLEKADAALKPNGDGTDNAAPTTAPAQSPFMAGN